MHDSTQVPDGWTSDVLINLAEYHNGAAFNAKHWAKDGLPIIRIEQINNPDTETDKYNGSVLPTNYINTGDLIFSWSATLKVVIWRNGPAVLNQHLYKVVPKTTIRRDLLLQILDFNMARLAGQSQGSTMKHVTRKELSRFRVICPVDFLEQQKIAEILQTIDQTIEKTEALIEKYQQIKAGLMHDLFTRGIGADGKLRPPREQAPELYQQTPIGWIPKEWLVRRISGLCSQIADCPHSTPVYRDSGIPCIRTADMVPGKLLMENAYCVDENDYFYRTQRMVPQSGDVIYSREGERLGIASPVGEEKICLGQRVMILRSAVDVDPIFLLWTMNHPDFYRRVTKGLGATTSPHVNVGDIQSIQVSVAPLAEQKIIGLHLKANQSKLDCEDEFRRKLLRKKSGLMQDLLTGKVQVKVDQPDAAHAS